MNVRELIALLEQFDGITEVYFEHRGGAYDVTDVEYGKVRWCGRGSPYERVEEDEEEYNNIPNRVVIIE